MKKLLLVPVLAASALVPMAQADNTATADLNIGAWVVESLAISQVHPLWFSPQVRPAAGQPATTQTVECSLTGVPTLTYGAGANPYANGVSDATSISQNSRTFTRWVNSRDITTCGKLKVTGQANTYYTISTQDPSAIAQKPRASITCASREKLNPSGNSNIWCGGTLTVKANTDTGSAGLSATVTVTYD